MAATKANIAERYEQAQQTITDLFLQQCMHGEQTNRLPRKYAACGQFIAGRAMDNGQLGLHGTAAALRVLAPCPSTECATAVSRMVAFCEAEFGIASSNNISANRSNLLTDEDKENVIKLGELLYALSFVTPAQATREPLIHQIAEKLKSSMRKDQGWGYFLSDNVPELLPTAYALRGLEKNGYHMPGAQRFLLDSLTTSNNSSTSSHADITTAVACTFCLTFCTDLTKDQKSKLKSAFVFQWRSLEPMFGEDIEQNLEYWRGGVKNEYVRIPFQLYLLALAAQFSIWHFAQSNAQRTLNKSIEDLIDGTFKYSYSGESLSSRTNSIAFDVILLIREHTRHHALMLFFNALDRVRVIAGSRSVRVGAALVAAGLISWAVWDWSKTGKPGDLAPELLSGFLTMFLTLGRRRT